MTRDDTKCREYALPDGRVVYACYKPATKNVKPYWRADFKDDDLVFVINEGGIPKQGKSRNPYAIYHEYDGETVAVVKHALEEDAKGETENPNQAAQADLEWDGGTLTGMESGEPLPDGRKYVNHPLAEKPPRTYIVIGKIIKS